MKTLTTILLSFFALTTTVNANITPVPVIKSEAITVTAMDEVSSELFINASYEEESENLVFETTDEINVIQIFKGNELEYQLPVMSRKVIINKNLFDSGEYKLGFIVAGKIEANYTKVNIK